MTQCQVFMLTWHIGAATSAYGKRGSLERHLGPCRHMVAALGGLGVRWPLWRYLSLIGITLCEITTWYAIPCTSSQELPSNFACVISPPQLWSPFSHNLFHEISVSSEFYFDISAPQLCLYACQASNEWLRASWGSKLSPRGRFQWDQLQIAESVC